MYEVVIDRCRIDTARAFDVPRYVGGLRKGREIAKDRSTIAIVWGDVIQHSQRGPIARVRGLAHTIHFAVIVVVECVGFNICCCERA